MLVNNSTPTVANLVFESDPDSAVLRVHGSHNAEFDSITIAGCSDVKSGLHVSMTDADFTKVSVKGVDRRGIRVDYHAPYFENTRIESCGVGFYVWRAHPSFWGGLISRCTTGAEACNDGNPSVPAELSFAGSEITNCTTGLSTSATEDYETRVELDSCSVENCTDGAILDKCSGHFKKCTFDGIDDTGITVTSSAIMLTIGGADSADGNAFSTVDGLGVNVGPDGKASIQWNEFEHVLGTSVEVESGTDSAFVLDCEFVGIGDCFEGIATAGSGTEAKIRNCGIHDYDDHMSPEPRAAIANGATADFGQTGDGAGNNSFYDNTINLKYASKAATPDSLYAKNNWWGSSPPDTSRFDGRWKYIAFSPWLTSGPRVLPTNEWPTNAPKAICLTNVHPNPGEGLVELSYWMPTDGRIRVVVYDLQGRLVRDLMKGAVSQGAGKTSWDGCDRSGRWCASGIYLARLSSDLGVDTARFVLMR